MSPSPYDKVRTVLIEEMHVDADRIAPEASLAELAMDSLETCFLVTALEEAFAVDVPDDDFQKLRTVQDVANYAAARACPMGDQKIDVDLPREETPAEAMCRLAQPVKA